MVEFHIHGFTENETAPDLLAAVEWIKDNYGPKIIRGDANMDFRFSFMLKETLFVDAVTTLQAIIAHFGNKLKRWNLKVKGEV